MKERFFLPQKQGLRLALAWLLPGLVCLVQWIFWDALGHFPWLLFYPAAFFAALIGGLWGGIGATWVATLLAWYFFLPPTFSLGLERDSDMLAVSVFMASGMMFSILLHRLMRSAETLRTLFIHAGDGIAIIDDSNGRFLDINVRHAAMLGRAREEIIGARVADFVIDFEPAPEAEVSAQMQSRGDATFERQLRGADGSALAVEVTVTPMQGKRVLAIVRDISRRREMEQMLKENNITLEREVAVRTQELQATVAELKRANAGKDAFMAAISHELRTPLMGILSIGELLESQVRGPLNPDQARYVRVIGQSGDRLLATVNRVLLYTSVMDGSACLQSEPCRLVELSEIAVSAVKPEAVRKRQRLTQEIDPFDLEIESDEQGVINILKMLLDNAIKFTPEEGCVSLSVMAAPEAGGVRIIVADTGIGMSEEETANLFHPFTQGDLTLARRYEGLGLGLAYVHKMVQLLGGALTVESALEQGSRFMITLPMRRG